MRESNILSFLLEEGNMRGGKKYEQTKGRRGNLSGFQVHIRNIPLLSESSGKPYLLFYFLLPKLGCFSN